MSFGRGSPRFNMMQAAVMQKKLSPRSGSQYKKGASPKVATIQKKVSSPKDRSRASWNIGLEKGLVELLHQHNNDCYRGQNGWSSEAWNIIVRIFHEKFPYVSFSKSQIQDKEKELKREYKMLKEVRKQSGTHWNEHKCMIEAEQPIWDNIIMSFPKAKKFQTKPFPLFDALGELYDGHTAEGTMNFTSVEPTQPSITQVNDDEAQDMENDPSHGVHDEEEEEELMLLHQSEFRSASSSSRSLLQEREDAAPREKGGKVGQKRKQTVDMVDMMGKYLKAKTKQVEEEAAEQARAKTKAQEDDFSIKACIAIVNTMQELLPDEKADAFDVFKDAQNREIFMNAALAFA
ncbi:uncharacterized protein LOC133903625 [Phragmites australis]|uniref:uncharacterized protein LOC133903625 n=1 Tax=Phragmites australis TaxID=29695 RepID=UPI002D77EB37|nr:uncharacterized protein LOC133903625 [Phragmites australis]